MSITEGIGEFLFTRFSRRGFLAKATVTATALSVAPIDLLVRPGTAYAQICECAPGYDCDCSALCCDGYTQFCCTINNGYNVCPPGTFAGGWWQAEGSIYCAGPRYYIDCMGECHGCGCGGGSFCPSCDGLVCECALGNCNNRHVGCALFRYGQCHQEIACSGRISCRVVSCTPPWDIDPTCTTASATDDNTANHFAPCQDGPTSYPPPHPTATGITRAVSNSGYWMVNFDGGVYSFGSAVFHGSAKPLRPPSLVVGIAATPIGSGYWEVMADGGVYSFGDAPFHGSARGLNPPSPIVGIAPTPTNGGYWLAMSDGGVYSFGDAVFHGSARGLNPPSPIVGITATPKGSGYWLVMADGGVYSFGDAPFHGSARGLNPPSPIVGIAPTTTNGGYWLVMSDGGVYSFGDAPFHGSARTLNPPLPITGIAATSTNGGYWLSRWDGAVYSFGDAQFHGSELSV